MAERDKVREVQPGETWHRLTQNRSFVGELIGNPEATVVKYKLCDSDAEFLIIAEAADKLFAHASGVLREAGGGFHNLCINHCGPRPHSQS